MRKLYENKVLSDNVKKALKGIFKTIDGILDKDLYSKGDEIGYGLEMIQNAKSVEDIKSGLETIENLEGDVYDIEDDFGIEIQKIRDLIF